MKKNRILIIGIVLAALVISCAAGRQGVKNMEKDSWPVTPVEIGFKERIVSIFPVSLNGSFGMIAGKPDHETLRIGEIRGDKLCFDVIPRARFKPASEKGLCAKGCSEMLMCGNRVLRWVNLEKKTEEIVYWGMGIVTQNTYQKMKVFDEEKRIVLTVVSPLYNDDFTEIVNNTSTITHDNLIDKKRVKQVPVCTESQEYKTNRRSDFNADPLVSFGSSFVIYRESHEYRWLSVNNELDYIDHPLRDTLNEYRDYFATDLVSLEIAPDRPHAVAICHQGIGQRHFASVIQWNKAPAVMPVPLTLQKNEDIEYSSLLLSPSGTWAYFNTSGGPAGSRHFLLYLDPDLPGGCLPPFELGVRASDSKATWITTPEGFVMQVGEKMLYWDLSRFDPRSFLWE